MLALRHTHPDSKSRVKENRKKKNMWTCGRIMLIKSNCHVNDPWNSHKLLDINSYQQPL